MDYKQKLSIANLILSGLIIMGALYYQDMMLGVLGLAALIFSVKRYKANFNIE
jgi:hypothetical protein